MGRVVVTGSSLCRLFHGDIVTRRHSTRSIRALEKLSVGGKSGRHGVRDYLLCLRSRGRRTEERERGFGRLMRRVEKMSRCLKEVKGRVGVEWESRNKRKSGKQSVTFSCTVKERANISTKYYSWTNHLPRTGFRSMFVYRHTCDTATGIISHEKRFNFRDQ